MQLGEFVPKDRFKIKGRGVMVVGLATSGGLKKGMSTQINGQIATIKDIQTQNANSNEIVVEGNEPVEVGILLSEDISEASIDNLIKSQTKLVFTASGVPPIQPQTPNSTETSKQKGWLKRLLGS